MNTLTEAYLLAKIKASRDPEAFGKLYDAYVGSIYRFIFFKVGSQEDAEDLSADVFLKTWNYLTEHGDEVKSFSALVYRIARTTIIDWYRARARKPTVSIDRDDAVADETSDRHAWVKSIHTELEHKEVLAAMERLKHDYQELIVLRYVEGFSIPEIAEITGKKALVIRVTLHRALKKLQELIKKD